MKFKYEFEDDDFCPGQCDDCPLAYYEERYWEDLTRTCVLGRRFDDCPLQEVTDVS